MKKISKTELEPQAKKFMEAHGVDSFLATEDGNFFHPKDKGLAHDHNNKNVKGEVHVFGKEEPEQEIKELKKVVPQHDVEAHGDKPAPKKEAPKKVAGKK